jgi:hypothetical protein
VPLLSYVPPPGPTSFSARSLLSAEDIEFLTGSNPDAIVARHLGLGPPPLRAPVGPAPASPAVQASALIARVDAATGKAPVQAPVVAAPVINPVPPSARAGDLLARTEIARVNETARINAEPASGDTSAGTEEGSSVGYSDPVSVGLVTSSAMAAASSLAMIAQNADKAIELQPGAAGQ